jgi:hypothetical protein
LKVAKRMRVGACGGAFMKWVDAAAELRVHRLHRISLKNHRLRIYEKVRCFRRLSCIRQCYRFWSRLVCVVHSREFVIRSCHVRVQSSRTMILIFVFRLFSHWRSLVVSKVAFALSVARKALLHSAFKSFTCIWLRSRSRSKELMLACTLLDQVR